MMIALHPTYTVRVRFKDVMFTQQNAILGAQAGMNMQGQVVSPKLHKFADLNNSKTGCDDFLAAIKDALQKVGLGNAEVTFEKFEQA